MTTTALRTRALRLSSSSTHPALRILPRSTTTLINRPSSVPAAAVPFTTSAPRPSGDDHGSHYDAPGGWLWGIPPGQKYEKEGWEGIWYYGFFGSLGLAAVAYAFKPDTR